jgi:dsRNA-specific ribonuclease
MYRRKTDYAELTSRLNYQFNDQNVLLQALTRPSALNEGMQAATIASFQRLEFIGDKVLNLIVSDILLEQYPTWQEGRLTQEAAKFVNNKGPLAKVASDLGLNHYLIMGRGEEFSNRARTNEKVLSDAVEALLGAMWLDSGHDYQLLRKFIEVHWKPLGLGKSTSAFKRFAIVEDNKIAQPYRARFKTEQELHYIFVELDDEAEIFEAFQQWLAEQDAASSLVMAAGYLYARHDTERPEYLKLLLEKVLLSQQDLDQLLVESFNFYEPGYDVDYKGAYEQLASIELLLQYGADPNACIYKKNQALLLTAIEYECCIESIELLLKYGADVDWTPSQTIPKSKGNISTLFKLEQDRNTALHKVSKISYFTHTHREIVELLVKYGAKQDLANQAGQTPLHLVCGSLFPSQNELYLFHSSEYDPMPKAWVIVDFIANSANVNRQDKQGNTPLHLLLKKWFSLSKPIVLDYIIEDSVGEKGALISSSTIFLMIFKKMLLAKSDLMIKNHAGESVINLVNQINLSRQELVPLAKDSELFSQPLTLDKLNYSLFELIPELGKNLESASELFSGLNANISTSAIFQNRN